VETGSPIQAKTEAFVRQLAQEFGKIDEENALSWLDAIEARAVEIGDAVTAELLNRRSADRPRRNRPVRSGASWAAIGASVSGSWSVGGGRSWSPSQNTTVLAVASPFSPRTKTLGVDVDCPFTPAMLRKIALKGSSA